LRPRDLLWASMALLYLGVLDLKALRPRFGKFLVLTFFGGICCGAGIALNAVGAGLPRIPAAA
jgi:hypothetical protein